jgi:predicted RNA binding protein YcfA (HicA-like mRNA interferase family)
MATYNYDEVRYVLSKLGFIKVRSRKHETWEKILENGTILQVRLSHKGKRDIPKGTFKEILRQAGINEELFKEILGE